MILDVEIRTVRDLAAWSDRTLSRYVQGLEQEEVAGSPTSPSRYEQLKLVVSTVRKHVQARLNSGWRRDEILGSGMTNIIINNMNSYANVGDTNDPASHRTPEENVVQYKRARDKLDKLNKQIQLAQKNRQSVIKGTFEGAMIHRRIIQFYIQKRGRKKQGMVVKDGPLTLDEARILKAMTLEELANFERVLGRTFGLCKEWSASVTRELVQSEAKAFEFRVLQVKDHDLMGVNLHSVVVVKDPNPFPQSQDKNYEYVIDAWKSPTAWITLDYWIANSKWSL